MYTVVYQSPLTVGIRCSPRSARQCAVLYYNYAPRFSQYKYTYTIGYPTNTGGVAYTVFTLELLHPVRYGTVRFGAVRACLHCSAQFRILSNKRGGTQVKIRMRKLK